MMLSGTLAEKGLHAFDGEQRGPAGRGIPRIWILVADRVRARIFRKTKDGIELIADAAPKAPEGAEGASRGHDFHGHDLKSRLRHHDDGAFIQNLAAWLDTAERAGVFDRIVLVAAPRTLGNLREALSKNVFTRVAAEVDRELTEMPEDKIKEHLRNIVWF